MNVCQLYNWNYGRCVEKQLSWWCFYLEISCHRLENLSFLLQLQFRFTWLPRLSVAICLCHTLLRCCCWNEGPDRKGFSLSSSFRKTSLELFFDLTDSVKWSLNSFPKRFSSLFCSNSTLFYNMFFASWGEHTLAQCCTFDGTKSNYLFDEANKWLFLEDLESRLETKEERQTSWHFPTLIIL